MENRAIIQKQLLFLLRGGNAHIPIKRAVANFPVEFINKFTDGYEHNAWQLLYHLEIAQRDIIEFIKHPQYVSPDWPEGYWTEKQIANTDDWTNTKNDFFSGLDEFESFIKNEKTDLFAPIPHAETYTIFREALVLAGHNAYHIGQLMMLKKILSV